jgi:photosystem II stability/assembly factor-like uncharacterized protein
MRIANNDGDEAPYDITVSGTAGPWAAQTSGTPEHLRGMHFTDANNGWAVGDSGTIVHTSDGGANWAVQISGTPENLFGVRFTDADNGWAVGDAGTIITTSNGGATWTPQSSGTPGSHLRGVHFTDAGTGWAVGGLGTILTTSDGGANWAAQTSGTTEVLLGMHFTDANNGWAVGNSGTIVHTSNGGATWAAQTSGTAQLLSGVHFTDANTGWAVGNSGTILNFSIDAPEINVNDGAAPAAADIANGGSAATFGMVAVGSSGGARTFNIDNAAGAADLTISGITFTGGDAGDFAVTSALAPGSPIPMTASATFQVTFTPSAGGARTTTMRIANNDGDEAPYDITVSGTGVIPSVQLSVNVNSGTEAAGTVVTAAATASAPVAGDQTVTIGASGTGITAGDGTLSSTTITIMSGNTSGNVTFTIQDDMVLEAAETAILTISSPSAGITLGATTTQNVMITDNDTATANLSVTTQGNEAGPVDAVYTVTLSKQNDTGSAITFDFDDLGTGSASSGNDYTAISGSATISVAAGQTTGTVSVSVTDDADLEATETVIAQISNSSHPPVTVGTGSASANITDNDTATANLSVMTQGLETGPQNIVVLVTLTKQNDTGSAITFDLDDLGTGSASSGNDYTAVAASISVADGQSTGTLTVVVTDDNLVEPATQDVDVQISNSSNLAVTVVTATASPTITDNDTGTFAIGDATVNEGAGTATFTVTLNTAFDKAVQIDVDYADVTATGGAPALVAPEDYDNDQDTLTFAANNNTAGNLSQTVTVAILDDTAFEGDDETYTASISTPTTLTGYSVSPLSDTGTGTITENDAPESTSGPVGPDFVITDSNGGASDDTITISFVGGKIRITDPTQTIDATPPAVQIDPNTIDVDPALFAGKLIINGSAGDDTLTIDQTAAIAVQICYNGGGNTATGDAIVLTGSSGGTHTYNFDPANPENGTIMIPGNGLITYTGLEPIVNSGTPADIIFNLPSGVNNTDTVLLDTGGADGMTSLTGTTFEDVTFTNPGTSLTINGGAMTDTISVRGVDAAFDANLTVTAGGVGDTVSFDTGATDMTSGNLAVTAGGGVTVTAAITTTGTIDFNNDVANNAAVAITGGAGVTVEGMSGSAAIDLNAANGTVTVNGAIAPNAGVNVTLTSDTVNVTGTGGITATGAGSITLNTDNLTLAGGLSGANTLTIQTVTASRSIGVGAGSGDLNIAGAEISLLSDGFTAITIGSAASGVVDVDTATFTDPVTIIGSDVAVTVLSAGANAVTLTAQTGSITDGGAGETDVTGSTVTLNAPNGAIGAGGNPLEIAATSLATDTNAGGAQEISEADTVSVTGIDAGAGDVQLHGGTFNLSGSDVIDNSTVIQLNGADLGVGANTDTIGGLNVTSAGGNVTGTGTLTSGAAYSFVGASTVDAILAGGVGFNFLSVGNTVTLNAANTFTGLATISAGTLIVDGSLAGAATVNVGFGAPTLLGGDGSISGAVTIQNSVIPGANRISPGNSPGILNTGNLNVSGTVDIEIGGTTAGAANNNHDQINVTGTVTLGGTAVLNPTTFNGFVPSPGDSFTIIENDGGDAVTGTFMGLAEGAVISDDFLGSGNSAVITYTGGSGNDVVIFLPEVSIAVSATPLAEDTAGTIDFTFTRTGPTTAAVTASFNVTGTAKLSDGQGDADHAPGGAASFTDAAGTVTIPIGQATAVVTIDPTTDNKVELDETVILTLVDGSGYEVAAGPGDTATGTITNDDQAIVSINTPNVDEAHAGEANPTLTFTISISNPVDVPVTVNIRTTDTGEAMAATTDFTAFGNTLKTFPADSTTDLTQGVTVTADDIDERQNGDAESLIVELNTIGATGRDVVFTGIITTPITGTGQVNNDDFDVEVTVLTDSADPTEHGENFTVTLTVATKVVGGATTPATPATANSLRVREAATLFGAEGAPPTITPMDNLVGVLRDATLTGEYDGIKNPGGMNFNPTNSTIMHVVNNIPEFTMRTGSITVNGAATGYNGADIAVQSGSVPVVFTVQNFIEQINSDRFDGAGMDNTEETQTVRFTLNAVVNSGAPGLFAAGPAVANSAGAGFTDQNLTFTVAPGASGIATITISATDNGTDLMTPGNGQQTTANQTFCISVYGTQPFAGDLAIADRGARVYNGSVMLVHTNAGSMAFPTQNVIDNGLVDAYELTVVTNSPLMGPLAGKSFLEYVVIDYETIVSAKGRGQQGLFGVNSVSQNRRTISTGQHFRVPLGVDLMPFEAGVATRGQFMVVDAEFEPALGKVILVDPTMPDGANQTLLTQGGELFFPTGGSVAPAGSPDAGDIYVTDVGNVFARKNNNERKIIRITSGGAQTALITEINNFQGHLENPPLTITNLYHPTGIDVDPVSGDLYIADSFSKVIWKLGRTGAGTFDVALTGVSVDADFLQPVHLAVAPNGGMAPRFIYITDGKTVAPGSAYAVGTRLLHKLDLLSIDANGSANSTIFTMDGMMQEPRGIEIIPTDPLTGN